MLARVMPHLLYQFSSEAELVASIEVLSLAFTKERHRLTDYLKDPRLVSAYAAFYLTTNLPKLEGILSWFTPEFREQLKSYQLIDLGAGPGTFSLAWYQLMGSHGVMVETSALMREQAKKLMLGLHGEEACFELREKKAPRLLLFGHSLNEMGVASGLDYIAQFSPDIVWFVEPGTKEVFQMMIEMRDQMVQSGWQIRFPCLAQGPCPMQGTSDWCHQYLHVKHEHSVERLTQLAQRDRRHLPVSVFIFDRLGETVQSEVQARIIRTYPSTKFSYEWEVCRAEEGKLTLERFEVPFRLIAKEERRAVAELLAGAMVRYRVEKAFPSHKRVTLIKD